MTERSTVLRFGVRTLLFATAAVAVTVWSVITFFTEKSTRLDFSPETLEFVYRFEHVIWFTDTSVRQTERELYDPGNLLAYLLEKGYWSRQATLPTTWRALSRSKSNARHPSFLAMLFANGEYWIKWSEEQDEIASIVWPIVLDLLKSGNVDDVDYDVRNLMNHAHDAEYHDEYQFVLKLWYEGGIQNKSVIKPQLIAARDRRREGSQGEEESATP